MSYYKGFEQDECLYHGVIFFLSWKRNYGRLWGLKGCKRRDGKRPLLNAKFHHWEEIHFNGLSL